MTRRSLIQRVLMLIGVSPASLIGCAAGRTANRGARRPVGVAPDPASELSRVEVEDLVALGEALVEGQVLVPAKRQVLIEHIENRAQRSPGFRSEYRTTARTLEHLAGRPFASLELRERLQLIARYGLAGSPAPRQEDLGPVPAEVRTIRLRTVPDLIRGYYASAAGWAVVGYQSFPGRCGDLTRYTRPES